MLPSPPKAIWTIGHSNRSFEEFAGLLEAHQITLLCDVRRYPGSKRYPHFSAEDLSKTLSLRNIGYVHLANLGGRREPQPASGNTAWRNKAFQGYADHMETPLFTSAIQTVTNAAMLHRAALMCAEALWWQCHRGLIADYLKSQGWEVIHILSSGKTQPHPFTSAARMVNGQLSYQASQASLDLGPPSISRCSQSVGSAQ